MTHQEMVDQVSDELRNTRIDTKITRWLNMAITNIASQFIFGHLNQYFSEATTPADPDILMDPNFHWLKTIQIPSDDRKLYSEDEGYLSEAYPDYRTEQGTITHYYINGLTISTWMVSGTTKTITGSYQKRAARLIDNFSIACDLPEEWHELVTQKAITRGYRYENNTNALADSKTEEHEIMKRIGAMAYKRPDDTLIIGTGTSRARPARPGLPAHYPASKYR